MKETQQAPTKVEQGGSRGSEGHNLLSRHLARWVQAAGATSGALWWIEGNEVTLQEQVGLSSKQLEAFAAHPEWLRETPNNTVTTPAPHSLEGWDEAALPTCLLRAGLKSEGSGRAVMLLLGEHGALAPKGLDKTLSAEGLALARDVEIAYLRGTGQRQDEALLEERKMFMAGRVVIFKWRNEPNWPVEYVSPNVGEVLGYSSEDWLSGKVEYASILHPDDKRRVAREVGDALESDVLSFTHEDYRVILGGAAHSDSGTAGGGQVRWLYDHTSLVRDEEGKVTHFLGYILDVTDRRIASEERLMLESKMQQAQKLESLGVLTGGLAHDFNNLLVGVLGNADLALSELPEGSSISGYLQSINLAAKRAADLVRQMLAYSGKGRFHVEPVDLRAIIEEMAHLLEAAISKKILLRFQFSDETPIVRADATQIRQVVMNLITNASDAIGTRNGLVTVRTGVRHCNEDYLASATVPGATCAGDYAFLEVTDTGIGMDRETREKIFDPFYSTKFTGRGLGLAAVQGIVRGHDGALFLKSSRGGGTTFKVYLPLKVNESTETEEAQVKAAASKPSVLLVDDEETVRSVAKRMLERMGLEVVIARDGSEALDTFRANPMRFDLVLLDMTMPNMGGEECLRELRNLRPDVRTILSSGFTEPKSLTELGEGARTGFLQKPYDRGQLTELVSSMLETI